MIEAIQSFFSINTTFFTLMDYSMSYVEFFGTIFTIWCVWLTSKAKILSWPIGIVGVTLYMVLFYQINLYGDMLEQGYFLITGFIGWYVWLHPKKDKNGVKNDTLKISTNSFKVNVFYAILVAFLTVVLAWVTMNLDNWLPKYFPEATTYPFLDAFTTTMSFIAQWLLVKKKLESWVLWIIVDVIGIWLYWVKGVKFISLEYVLFLGIAISGLIGWHKEHKSYSKQTKSNLETETI
ncbi:MAG: nicotinamide riboside transporter PnuC [Patescibacteria group bacterium]